MSSPPHPVDPFTETPLPSGVPGVREQWRFIPGGAAARLAATLVFPEQPGAVSRGVVTLHGWGGNGAGPHRILVRLTRALASRGLPCIRFDFSGRGLSEGAPHAVSLDGMIADALAAEAHLRSVSGCVEIAWAGICSGGNVAIGAASVRDAARLALLSTLPFAAPSGGRVLRAGWNHLGTYARKALSPSTWGRLLRGEVSAAGVHRTLSAAGESAEERARKNSSRDIPADFARRHAPCLFVYGGADPEAPEAWTVYERYAEQHGIPARRRVVEGANHNFYSTGWSRSAEEAVLTFLTEDLPPPERVAP